MARLPYADVSGSEELRTLAAQMSAKRGNRLFPLYGMLLNSPPVAAGWLQFFTAIRQQSELDGRSRELAILYVGLLTGCDYNVQAHVHYAREEGLTQAQIDNLENWRTAPAPLYSAAERAVLAYTSAMTDQIRVADEVFDALRPHFTPRQIVELTATVGGYALLTRFYQAMEIDPYVSG